MGAARSGQAPEKKTRANFTKKPVAAEKTEEEPKIQRSAFDVLSNDDDEEETADEETKKRLRKNHKSLNWLKNTKQIERRGE